MKIFLRNSETIFTPFTITDNYGNTSDDTIKALKEAMNDNYIVDGKMKDANKGIKEMRMSAAWLRNSDEDTINSEARLNNGLPIMLIDKTLDNNLQFIFFLCKPRKLAFVFDEKSKVDLNKLNSTYNEKFCFFYKHKDLTGEHNINFEIFIVENDSVKEEVERLTFAPILIKSITDFEDVSFENFIEEYTIDFCKQNGITDLPNIQILDDGKNDLYAGKEIFDKVNVASEDPSLYNNSVIYKSHYSTKKEFNELENALKLHEKQPQFIETISGHDSTDRLIRHEKLNKTWYYKHLVAALTRVAIFDERIFSNCYKIKASDCEKLIAGNEINLKEYLIAQRERKDISEENKVNNLWYLMKGTENQNLFFEIDDHYFKPDTDDQTQINILKKAEGIILKQNNEINIPIDNHAKIYSRKNIHIFQMIEISSGFAILGADLKCENIVWLGTIQKSGIFISVPLKSKIVL